MAASQYFTQVQQIYVAYYQRPADPAGMLYWAQQIDAAHGNLDAVINAFANSAESLALYGPITSATIGVTIDSIYLSLFNRLPDPAGKQWYIDAFNAGDLTAGEIAYAIEVGATGTDAQAIGNKLTAANDFTQQVDGGLFSDPGFGVPPFNATYSGTADATQARTWLAAVRWEPSTVPTPSDTTAWIIGHIADPTDPIVIHTTTTFTLTPAVDIVHATLMDSVVIGNNLTLTTGDQITGLADTKMNYTVVDGTAAGVATINTLASVNVTALDSNTTNAGLWTNVGAVNVVSGSVGGKTTTLNNLNTGTTIGISSGTNSNVTATFINATGAADKASLVLGGSGKSTSSSAVNIGGGNDIESVAIATSGTNYDDLALGTGAATVAITGTGTNTMSFTSTAAKLALTSSASGTQKYTFVAGSIDSNDSIVLTGEATNDQVTANSYLSMPTLSGVETYVTTLDTTAVFDMTKVTGLKTLTANQGAAAQSVSITSATTLETLNIAGPTGNTSASYKSGTDASLTINYNLGSKAGTAGQDSSFDGVTVSDVKNLTINFNGAAGASHTMGFGDIKLDKANTESLVVKSTAGDWASFDVYRGDSLKTLSIVASGESSSLCLDYLYFASTKNAVQGLEHLSIVASGDYATAYVYDIAYCQSWDTSSGLITDTTNAFALKDLSMVASGADSYAFLYEGFVTVGDMDSLLMEASGDGSYVQNEYTWYVVGNVGTVDLIASGVGAGVYFSECLQIQGDVGSFNIEASGVNSYGTFAYTAWVTGDIGPITVSASASDAYAYVYWLDISGDVTGDVNLVASGADSSAAIDYLYADGGLAGDVNIVASGASSSACLYDLSLSGDLTGDINIVASGRSSCAYLEYFCDYGGGVDGAINITASGENANAYLYEFTVSGDVGSVNVTASGDSASAYIEYSYIYGDLGGFTMTASGDYACAAMYDDFSVTGDVGPVVLTASGVSAYQSFDGYYMCIDGDLASLAVLASGACAYACDNYFYVNGGHAGAISIEATGYEACATAFIGYGTNDLNLDGAVTIAATGAYASACLSADLNLGSLSGKLTMAATKVDSFAYGYITANTIGAVAIDTGIASSGGVELNLSLVSQSGTITAVGSGPLWIDVSAGQSITSLSAGTVKGAIEFYADGTDTKSMTITTGLGNDTIWGSTVGDTINVGSGTDTVYYVGDKQTQQGVLSTGFAVNPTAIDLIYGMGSKDKIDLLNFSNLTVADGAISIGTTFATATANQVLIVSGTYSTSAGTFTSGAVGGTNNDYLLQFNGGTTTTTVNSILLVDIVGTLSVNSSSEVLTLTVA